MRLEESREDFSADTVRQPFTAKNRAGAQLRSARSVTTVIIFPLLHELHHLFA
jgi:hypothetical protein